MKMFEMIILIEKFFQLFKSDHRQQFFAMIKFFFS